ncbi:MAG TPA: hypothetical protein VFY39_11985 [Gammaproteobacteria bacterium]|nr:hypothetical protein [Gammaproteobacteria bacterium]
MDEGLLASSSGTGFAVQNSGEIDTAGGQVLLTASAANDVLAQAVNNDGVIRAARVENVGGHIRLAGPGGSVVNSGTLDAAGADAASTGGQIEVLGQDVDLAGSSHIDVSGSAGGGTALIGGGFRGADPSVFNAEQTRVQAGALISADSTASGDAGRIAVWADGTTRFAGTISARAMGPKGDGGYAEVSGHEHLGISGHAWLGSLNGASGTLLLDPSGGSVTVTQGADTAPPASMDTFNDGWIIAQLNDTGLQGGNLTIDTDKSKSTAGPDLTVDGTADISWASANSLTLHGADSVTLDKGSVIANTGTGGLALSSDGSISMNGTISLVGNLAATSTGSDIGEASDGTLDISGTSTFTVPDAHSVLLDSATNSLGGSVTVAASSSGTLEDVSIRNGIALSLSGLTLGGNLSLNAAGALTLPALTVGGNLGVSATSIAQSGPLRVTGTSSFTAASGNSVTLGDTSNSFTGTVSFASGSAGNLQDVTFHNSAPTTLDLQALTLDGNLSVVSGAGITQAGALKIGGTSSLTAAAGQSIVLGNAANGFTGAVTLAPSSGQLKNVTLHDSSALDLQALDISGALNVSASAITQSGALAVGGASSFSAAGGQSITLGSTGNALTGAVSFASNSGTSLQNVTLNNSKAADLAAIDIVGNLIVTAGGSISQSGVLRVGGVSTFTAPGGNSIELGNTANSLTGSVSFASGSPGNLLNVTLGNSTALNLQALTLDGTLSVTSGAGISQSGALAVAGASSFKAADGTSILLGNPGNSFGGKVTLAAGTGKLQNVTLNDSTELDLQALSLAGNLSVTSGAGISQTGALAVTGGSSFVAGSGSSILLGNAGNSFSGSVTLASAGGGQLQDVSLGNSGPLNLPALALDGNLIVTAGGSITQAGPLVVGGTSSFTAAAGNSIALNDANDFVGAVSFLPLGGTLADVTIRDTGALLLNPLDIAGTFTAVSGGALAVPALTIGGGLSLTSGGAITQSGSLDVTGSASFTTLDDTGAAITLDAADNHFGSIQAAVRNAADSANAAADIVIHENDATLLGNVETAAGQEISLQSAGALTMAAGAQLSASSVSLSAAGDVGTPAAPLALLTSSGQITATSPGSIYIANASSGGLVTLEQIIAGSAGSLSFTSDGSIRAANVEAGDSISLTSTGGSLFDDGADGPGSELEAARLTLAAAGSIGEPAGTGNGTLDLDVGTLSANAQGGGVYVNEAAGSLGLRQITAAGPVWIAVPDGSLSDDPGDGAAASIVSGTGGIALSALDEIGTVTDVAARQGTPIAIDTNGGALSAQVASATGQVNLDIAGGSAPTAGPAAISAGGAGRLLLQSSGDLSLSSLAGAIAGFSQVGLSADGALALSDLQSDLITGGLETLLLRGSADITSPSRVLDFSAGHLIFESGGQGGAVTLKTQAGLLDASIGNGADLTIDAPGDLTLGSINAGGRVSIRAANILDDGDINGVTRVSSGTGLSLTASGGIGQADGAGGGRLDTAGGALSFLANAGSAYISHAGDLDLQGKAQGTIDIQAPTGGITVDGGLQSAGALSLSAGADAAGLNPAVEGDIALLGNAQAGGAAVLSAHGSGAIGDASDAAIHLSAATANLIAGRIGSAANPLDIDAASLNASASDGLYVSVPHAVRLGALRAGDLVIEAAGALSDDGDAATRLVADNASLTGTEIGAPGAGNEIATDVGTLSASASSGGIYIGELNDVELGTIAANGAGDDVVITAPGTISDDGNDTTRISGGHLALTGAALGAAGSGHELDTQADSLTASASAGGIFIGEADGLQLDATTASGDLRILAGGALTDDGDRTTRIGGGNVALSASAIGASDNPLDTAAGVLSAFAAAGGVYVSEQDSVTLADVEANGAGHGVDVSTADNGSIIVQNLTTQGGAVNLTAGGTGSLNVTGAIDSHDGLVNLTSGNALTVPGLSTGAGSVVLHTVNDLNVGTVMASSITITSDTGNVSLGTVNAGTGTASITASNGSIGDADTTSLTAGSAALSAQSIGSAGNPLDVAVGSLTANASAGGVFINEADDLDVAGIQAAGIVNLLVGGALTQSGGITSNGNPVSLRARSIAMQTKAFTKSAGGNIIYVAHGGDLTLGTLDAGAGRVLAIAAGSLQSALGSTSVSSNITASEVEIRAGGLQIGSGELGTADSPLAISAPSIDTRSVFVVVPTVNGVQTITPRINFSGSSQSLLLKGYTGSSGALFFDETSTFTPDAVVLNGESIVPLQNGRIAVNSDSLSAATQALASGVVNRVNIDWAAFDPNVSLFGTLDPPLRLPDDQLDEAQ